MHSQLKLIFYSTLWNRYSLTHTISTSSIRRSSWVQLLPRAQVAEETGDMAAVNRDKAIRELLRNAPEVFTTGMLKGFKPSIHWKELYTPTEIEIIEQCTGYTSFDTFCEFMVLLFPDKKRASVVHRSMKLWDQILTNRGE